MNKYFFNKNALVLVIVCSLLISCNSSNEKNSNMTSTDSTKKSWYKGMENLNCDFQDIQKSVSQMGQHFVKVVGLMPGIIEVELLEEGPDFVTIKTNEGLMKRTNIALTSGEDKISLSFDENYDAGSKIKAESHYDEVFEKSSDGTVYHLSISNVTAPGFLGFFYRKFGSGNIGKAILGAHKKLFESE